MNFSFKDIWAHMGPSAVMIAGLLVLMAVASLAVVFERLYVYRRSARRNRTFARLGSPLLKARCLRDFLRLARATDGSHLAQLLGRGVETFLERFERQDGKLPAVELARRELERENERITADIRRGLPILATVGSVSPFVGLLGTVVGIISAFQGIAHEGSGGLSAVSGGISEALVETALGLVVAIPAVFFFNLCSSRSEKLLRGLDQARSELLDLLEELGEPQELRPVQDDGVVLKLAALQTEGECHVRST
jgi:biopolymer transport protein ExbB